MIEVTDNLNFIDLLTVTLNLEPFLSAAPHMHVCITEPQALKKASGICFDRKMLILMYLKPFGFLI